MALLLTNLPYFCPNYTHFTLSNLTRLIDLKKIGQYDSVNHKWPFGECEFQCNPFCLLLLF